MTESEKTLKTALVKYILSMWENKTKFRWSDVIDYICDNWKLDEDWEGYFEESAQELFNKSFDDCMTKWFAAEKYKQTVDETEFNKITDLIVEKLEKRLDEDLEKKL